MKGYVADIEKQTLENNNFRTVLYTAKHSQLVVMSLPPEGEIGMEVHPDNDQFLRFEQGTGKAIIDGHEYDVENGSVVIVPAGAEHNVVNTSDSQELKLYTLYAPAHHRDGVVHKTRAEAEADHEEFDGVTTE